MAVCLLRSPSPFRMANRHTRRLHDLLPRVAHGQYQPRHQQLHVQMGISCVLQHALGVYTLLFHLYFSDGYHGCPEGSGSGVDWEEGFLVYLLSCWASNGKMVKFPRVSSLRAYIGLSMGLFSV